MLMLVYAINAQEKLADCSMVGVVWQRKSKKVEAKKIGMREEGPRRYPLSTLSL
jgi:hypothetical protein